MMKSEKGIATHDAPKTKLNQSTMNNTTPTQKEFQLDLPQPRKHLNTITCHDCRHQSELAGYRLAFVPLCECCRIEREVKITGARFERRHKQ